MAPPTALTGEYLFISAFSDHAVNVFSVDRNGKLQVVDKVIDDENLLLNGTRGIAVTKIGDATYLFVAGENDNGLSVFRVANDEKLINSNNVSNSFAVALNGARGITTVKIGNATYLFVGGKLNNGITVFSVASDGVLTNVEKFMDNDNINLAGVTGIVTKELNGITYLFAAGEIDDGVSVLSVADDNTLPLDGASSVNIIEVNGSTYLLVGGLVDDGVTMFA